MQEVAWESVVLVAGLLFGFALSPFATPDRVIGAFAIGAALMALRICHALLVPRGVAGSRLWRALGAITTLSFALAWFASRLALQDHRPSLAYSLTLLTADDAVAFAQRGPLGPEDRLYRFQATNL